VYWKLHNTTLYATPQVQRQGMRTHIWQGTNVQDQWQPSTDGVFDWDTLSSLPSTFAKSSIYCTWFNWDWEAQAIENAFHPLLDSQLDKFSKNSQSRGLPYIDDWSEFKTCLTCPIGDPLCGTQSAIGRSSEMVNFAFLGLQSDQII
jgi:hypothetical protein